MDGRLGEDHVPYTDGEILMFISALNWVLRDEK